MPIEIILREHVDHLGRRGEVVKVASGYARNYLLPRRLALAVTAENKRQIERERVRADAKDSEELQEARALQARLQSAEVIVGRRVGENETLYGSVTSGDIAEALALQDLTVDRRRIQLDEPLKAIGEFTVPIRIHRDVTADVTVKVVPAE